MSDQWEGSFSAVNQAIRPKLYGEHYEEMFSNSAGRRAAMLERIHMNCWNLAEFESAAMWEIYEREGRGVAIRTTWGALTSSITSSRQVFGARIKYADYLKTFIPEGNLYDASMHKRESYSHEQEVRLIMMSGLSEPHPTNPDEAIDLGPEAPILPIAVDLQVLIQEVFVAPNAPSWIADLILKVTRKYQYSFPVMHSDLARDPIA